MNYTSIKLFKKKKSIRQARSGKGISGNEMAGAEAEQQERNGRALVGLDPWEMESSETEGRLSSGRQAPVLGKLG